VTEARAARYPRRDVANAPLAAYFAALVLPTPNVAIPPGKCTRAASDSFSPGDDSDAGAPIPSRLIRENEA